MNSELKIPKKKHAQPAPESTSSGAQHKNGSNSGAAGTIHHSGPSSPENILALQKTVGNQAVSGMLRSSQTSHSGSAGVIQREMEEGETAKSKGTPNAYGNYGQQKGEAPADAMSGYGSNYGQQKDAAPAGAMSHYGSNYGQQKGEAPADAMSNYGSNYGQQKDAASAGAMSHYGSNYGQQKDAASAGAMSHYGSNYGQPNAGEPAQPAGPAAQAPGPKGKFDRESWKKNLPGKDSQAVKLSKGERYGQALRPAPLKLPEKYKDENKKIGWRARFDEQPNESPELQARRARSEESDRVVTRHYTPEERQKNTLGSSTPDRAPAEYAMSPKGQSVLSDGKLQTDRGGGKTANLHHSTMFAGGDVAHAGNVGVSGGKVNYLDDDSGHYRPSAGHTWDAYNRMKAQGMLSNKGSVSMVDKTKQKGVDADYGQSKLSLPFSSYEQTHGNEEQARKKKAMLQEMLTAKK